MHQQLLEVPRGICAGFNLNSPGALFEPSLSTSLSSSSDGMLISKLISVLDTQLLDALESRSLQEFKKRRQIVLPRYIRALRALSDTMSNLVEDAEIDRMTAGAIEQITADLERERGARFSDKLVDQALFTIWTFGKMHEVGRRIVSSGMPKNEELDFERSVQCHAASFVAQFHMDILVAAMKFKKSLKKEIQEETCEGLRNVVNAYALMREALDDRTRVAPKAPQKLPWDEEDESLLAASMRDINAIASENDC